MLKRARYRPDVLPAFQDITTVRRDFRGQNGRPATNAKPRWTPAKHSKFDDKTENKNYVLHENPEFIRYPTPSWFDKRDLISEISSVC
ncbi:unnamed protein product [Oikopleura dioica]|uniref:Uncharacterized protein n=1 Tax=Oikopleura dioica TaxID=34765 RepID=E4YRT0_OIKDI|nr:unnamed protein product [Oikopleura dioica]CBY39774.1 unnamed protein product [Oikopleura dioica]